MARQHAEPRYFGHEASSLEATGNRASDNRHADDFIALCGGHRKDAALRSSVVSVMARDECSGLTKCHRSQRQCAHFGSGG